jgi:hypothetical protein
VEERDRCRGRDDRGGKGAVQEGTIDRGEIEGLFREDVPPLGLMLAADGMMRAATSMDANVAKEIIRVLAIIAILFLMFPIRQ